MGADTIYAMAMATVSIKEVSEGQGNQLALDGPMFLKFISDSLITEEQWADLQQLINLL